MTDAAVWPYVDRPKMEAEGKRIQRRRGQRDDTSKKIGPAWRTAKNNKSRAFEGGIGFVSILPVVTPMIKNVCQNHFAPPKIPCVPGEEQDAFKVPDEFRAVKLTLKAQVIVQCGIHVMSIITVENLYEDELIIFKENSGVAKKKMRKQADHLRLHIDQEIRRALTEAYGEEIFQEIGPLNVNFSLLGGTEYQNLRGNARYRQCIISQDGLVQDYNEDERIIKKRMNTIHLQVKDRSIYLDKKTRTV